MAERLPIIVQRAAQWLKINRGLSARRCCLLCAVADVLECEAESSEVRGKFRRASHFRAGDDNCRGDCVDLRRHQAACCLLGSRPQRRTDSSRGQGETPQVAPKTIGEASCCLHDGDNDCATAFHGEINGIRYYAARKQRACYPANVATETDTSPQTFKMDDPDHCSCRVSAFIPAAQLFKASLSEEEMLVSGELQGHGAEVALSPRPSHCTATMAHVCWRTSW